MGHESEDSTIARMQSILLIAHDLREATATFRPPSDSPTTTSDSSAIRIDSINLPTPQPLLPFLLEVGATHEIAAAASRVYQLRAGELRQHIRESIVTVWHKIAQLPRAVSVPSSDQLMRKVVSTATEVYLRRLEQWKEDVQRVTQRSATPIKVAPKNSRAFNHVSVPIVRLFSADVLCRNTFHYWSIFSRKIRFRRMQTRRSSPRNRVWNTGKSMYG